MILTNNLKPVLRFKGFKDNWTLKKLTEKCIISAGRNTPDEPDGKYYNLTMGSVSEEGKLLCSLKTNETTHILKKGDLIMPTRDVGAGLIIGRTAYIPDNSKYFAGNCLYVLTVQTDLDSLFLTNYMNSNLVRKQFSKVISGGSQKQITLPNVKGINIKLPNNIEEQQKIGTFFSNLDNTILLNQYKLNKLINVKKALLEKMFPANGTNVPEFRFKGFVNDWELKQYLDLGESSSGGSLSYNDLSENGTYKCVLYGELYTHYDCVIKNIVYRTNIKSNTIIKNDILFPQSTTVDALSLISPACMNEDTAETSGVFVIRPKTTIDGNFIVYYTKGNPYQRRKLAKRAQGLTIVHLYYQSIKDESIFIPSHQEQTQISNLFLNVDNLINLYKCKLEKLKNLKKACLEDMFV